MKILALDFKNINSLKGEHHIDFTAEEFTRNPLFAITGPTGSGKTTLLDVISLALFDEIPRLGKISNRVIEEQGAVLTRNQEEAYAKVTYSCREGVFASVWEISTARTGNLRDYEMELTQIDPLRRLDFKKSEIPGRNEELIGLSYSQFIKSVVLAQGEFSKFLKSPKMERSELLEKITGTGIYRELGILAYRRFKDQNKEIEKEENVLAADKEKLLSAEDKAEKKKKSAELDQKIGQLKKTEDKIKDRLRLKEELEQLGQRLAKKRKELTARKEEREEFEKEFGKKIKRHEEVEEFSVSLYDWENQKKQLKDLRKEGEKLQEKQQDLVKGKAEMQRKIREFIRNPVEEVRLIPALDEFYRKVSTLQEQVREFEGEFKAERNAFRREVEDLALKENVKALVTHPERWARITNRFKEAGEELSHYFKGAVPEDFDKRIDTARERLQALKSAGKEQEILREMEKDREKMGIRLKEIGHQLSGLPTAIKDLSQAIKLQEKSLENMELRQRNRLLAAKVEDLRSHLETGKPCPVCGSTAHPYAVHAPQKEEGLEIAIKAARNELKEKRRELSAWEADQKNLTRQKSKLEEDQDQLVQKLNDRKVRFEKEYAGVAGIEETEWKKKIGETTAKIEELQRFKRVQKEQAQIHRAKPVFERLQSIYQQGKQAREQVEEYYAGDRLLKDYQDLHAGWQKSKQNLQTIEERLKEHGNKIKSGTDIFQELADHLIPKLAAKGFAGIREARETLLPGPTYRKYRENRDRLTKLMTELVSGIKTEEEREKTLREKLDSDQSKEKLEQEYKDVAENLRKQTEEREEVNRRIKNDDLLLEQIRKQEKKIKEWKNKNLRWKLLRELIGDAKGDRFNQFAQDLTLRHLLGLANKRLKHISGRYRLMIRKEVGKNDDNLVVADLDMGGQERAVQTLSGGETFLMSLALALALSDLASKNVQINSLFIDEGFGTLDPETLDQTLDTLERLQASSNKTIGIISHVESLKERIATQIQLERNGQGYSSLKIVTV